MFVCIHTFLCILYLVKILHKTIAFINIKASKCHKVPFTQDKDLATSWELCRLCSLVSLLYCCSGVGGSHLAPA